jgi:hypothetical protein
MEMQGLHPDDIQYLVDPTVYVVLHCQTTYFSFSRLQTQFIRKFAMTDKNDMYILPAGCLRNPLLVVPDVMDEEFVSDSRFMAVCPRHKMGAYFLYYVRSYIEQHGANDDSDNDNNDLGIDIESDDDSAYLDNW